METRNGMIKSVTQQVLNQIQNDKEIQAGDMARITELVNEKILPVHRFHSHDASSNGSELEFSDTSATAADS